MPFPWIAAATALGSGLNFASGLRNSNLEAAIARENTDKTIKANREMAELAYQRDFEQWKRANDYNSPYNQMARLRSAGVNPMLALGASGTMSGNTAQAGSPQFQAPDVQYEYKANRVPQLDVLSTLGAYQDYRLREAQVDNVKQQTEAVRQETMNNSIRELLLRIEAAFGHRKGEASTRILETDAKYREPKSLVEMSRDIAATEATRQDMGFKAGMFAVDLAGKQILNQLRTQEVAKLKEDIKTIPLQREMLSRQSDKVSQETQTEIGKQLMLDLQRELERLNIASKSFEFERNLKGQSAQDPWYIRTADYYDRKWEEWIGRRIRKR